MYHSLFVSAIIGQDRFGTFPFVLCCFCFVLFCFVVFWFCFLPLIPDSTFLTVVRHTCLFLSSFHLGIPLDIFSLLLKHLITQILCQELINYLLFVTNKYEKMLNNARYL